MCIRDRLEGASEPAVVVDWLAQRIREIERFVGQLPSIAIFVASEAEAQDRQQALSDAFFFLYPAALHASRPARAGDDSTWQPGIDTFRTQVPKQVPPGSLTNDGRFVSYDAPAMPAPVAYMMPRLNCASAYPCSPALRYQLTAS